MAVDLVNYQKMEEHVLIHESSSSMINIEEQLIRLLKSHNHELQFDESKGFAVSRSGGNRTGHARFRRAPADVVASSSHSEPVKPVEVKSNVKSETKTKTVEESKSVISVNSSGSSSITGEEGTVSNGKQLLAAVVTPAPRTFSSGKPPLPTSHRKRCREIENIQSKPSNLRGCHCCKKRKTAAKREIKRVRVSGSADAIPADEYSWKKYDQKLIPGMLFPRGYYKCNSAKGCPARKYVERTSNDPTVLILAYEGEHRHHHHHHRSHSPSHRFPKEALTRLNNSSGLGLCY